MSNLPPIQTRCTSCDATLQLPADTAGKQGRCPSCNVEFTIPNAWSTPVTTNAYQPPTAESAPQTSVHAPIQTNLVNHPPLGLMIVPLYISAALYALAGLGVAVFMLFIVAAAQEPEAWFIVILLSIPAVLSFVFAGFVFFFTSQLSKRKKWAWITAIIFAVMYTSSAFIILGIPILIGALRRETVDWFNTA